MITFTTDIGNVLNLTTEEFRKEAISMIDFAVNEKEYLIENISADFIASDITGIIVGYNGDAHGITSKGLYIIDQEINKFKIKAIIDELKKLIPQENFKIQPLTSKKELRNFETKYDMTTSEFINKEKDISHISLIDRDKWINTFETYMIFTGEIN